MAVAEINVYVGGALPVFESDFDHFMEFLQADANSALISPKRFGQVMAVDMQTLAGKARVHRNTISRAPESESVQRHLRDSLRVIRAALDVAGTVEKAVYWFKNNPLPAFDYMTPQDLVSEGRTDVLVRYVQSLQAGFAG
jgi:uncharacterized protein (DUF2384 family)